MNILKSKTNSQFARHILLFWLLAIWLLGIYSCTTKPRHKDDPDYWIYQLQNYAKNPKVNIERIINVYNNSSHNTVKMYTISLLQNATDNPKALEIIINELSNKNKLVKIEAIKALGKSGLESVTNKLIELLYKDVEQEEKIEICNSLGKIGDKRAIPPLIDILNSKDAYIVYSCSDALHQITKQPLKDGRTIKSPKDWLEITKNK